MEILVGVGAVQTVQKSSKSEPSSRFFGRLKIFAEKFAVRIAEGGNNGGGPEGAEAPPGPSVVGSIGSIIRSVRSIIVQPTSVDRSANVRRTSDGAAPDGCLSDVRRTLHPRAKLFTLRESCRGRHELRTSVYPSNFAPIAAKIRQRAFQTICKFRFFDAKKNFSQIFLYFFSVFRHFRSIFEELGFF